MVQEERKDDGGMASPHSSFVVFTGASTPEVGAEQVCCKVAGCRQEELLRKEKGCSWKIETKYYTSETVVKVLNIEDLPRLSTAPQALVAVFDIKEEDTFTQVKQALESSVFSQPWFEEVEVRLMLANRTTEESSLNSLNEEEEAGHWLSRCYNWCRDECFEYVEVSTGEDQVDKKLTLFEDPQGIARVIEVLHCHRWPGSMLLTHKQQTDAANEGDANKADRSELVEAAVGPSRSSVQVEEDTLGLTDTDTGKDEGQVDLENFERLLSQVSAARQESEKLPDDQRRKVAEQMLFKIMGEMGISDDHE